MNWHKMMNLDLRILTIVNELSKTRSVSQAAQNLEISQSTVSMSLARLRRHFKDPLFVRTSEGMEPTPRMSELSDMLERAELLLETALSHETNFDPSVSERTFYLGTTEIIRATALPALVRRLRTTAPRIRVDVQDINIETPRQLESGRLDVAVGIVPAMGSGFCLQRLFKERFVCAVRTNHPRIHAALTLQQFEQEPHLGVTTLGCGIDVVEKALDGGNIVRNVRWRVSGSLGISSLLTSTDCLAIVPEQLGNMLANMGRIKLLAPPFELPQCHIAQHWHERYAHDPGLKWFRQVISDLFSEINARNLSIH
jgi:DNA-binding transcriptional LysR family regulator